ILNVDAEVSLVPGAKHRRILRLEENPSDSSDSPHQRSILFASAVGAERFAELGDFGRQRIHRLCCYEATELFGDLPFVMRERLRRGGSVVRSHDVEATDPIDFSGGGLPCRQPRKPVLRAWNPNEPT